MRKYRLIAKKGEGTFSEVLKAQNIKSGSFVAIKCMRNKFKSIDQVNNLREIQALRRLMPHPNIVTLEEVLYDKPTGRLALVFELMSMNLYELIRGRKHHLNNQLIKIYAFQALRALDQMHSKGVFHRDIKPENILIESSYDVYTGLKLADFGSCRGIKSKQPYTEYISTRWYRAPECLLTDGYYGAEMDIWGIGCVFFELSALFPLFPGENEKDQMSKIHKVLGTPNEDCLAFLKKHQSRHMTFSWPHVRGTGFKTLIPHVPELFRDLLEGMLQYDPRKRISARDAVTHPYFADLWATPMPAEVASAAPAPPGAPVAADASPAPKAPATKAAAAAGGSSAPAPAPAPSGGGLASPKMKPTQHRGGKSPESVDSDYGDDGFKSAPSPVPGVEEVPSLGLGSPKLSGAAAPKAEPAHHHASGKTGHSGAKAASKASKASGAAMAYLSGGGGSSQGSTGSHQAASGGARSWKGAGTHKVGAGTHKDAGVTGNTFGSVAGSKPAGSGYLSPSPHTTSYLAGVAGSGLSGGPKRAVGIKKVTRTARHHRTGGVGKMGSGGGATSTADLAARHKQIMRRSRVGGGKPSGASLVPGVVGGTSLGAGGSGSDFIRSLGASASSATVGGGLYTGPSAGGGGSLAAHRSSMPTLGTGDQVSLGGVGRSHGTSLRLAGRGAGSGISTGGLGRGGVRKPGGGGGSSLGMGASSSLASLPRTGGGGSSYAAMGAARSGGGPKGFSSGSAAKYFGSPAGGGASYKRTAPKSSTGLSSGYGRGGVKRTAGLRRGPAPKSSMGLASKYRLR